MCDVGWRRAGSEPVQPPKEKVEGSKRNADGSSKEEASRKQGRIEKRQR
jgi:hypothetical protein